MAEQGNRSSAKAGKCSISAWLAAFVLGSSVLSACQSQAPVAVATSTPADATAWPDIAPGTDDAPSADLPVVSGIFLLDADPPQGPTAGLTAVVLHGSDLGATTAVDFGAASATSVQVLDTEHVLVTAPPHAAGEVDVTVHAPGLPDAVLPHGFRYVATVTVTSVQPSSGPAQGGTAVTIEGTGFSEQTTFAFGDRLALHVVVQDANTATVLTPPGVAGKVRVAASNIDGTAVLKNAFLYQAPPQLTGVEPAVGALQGGGPIALIGKQLPGFAAKVSLIQGGISLDCTIAVSQPDAKRLTVTAPAASVPGAYDVVYANAQGNATLLGAYHYVAAAPSPSFALVGVAPSAQPVNQLQPVDLAVVGALTANNLAVAQVTLNGQPANLQWSQLSPDGVGATLRVQPPVLLGPFPKTVDIAVDLGQGAQGSLTQAFTYLPQVPVIQTISPLLLDPAGGTGVTIHVLYAPASKVVGVQIGALPGQILSQSGDLTLTAAAPQGAPGPADAQVYFANGQVARLDGALHYASLKARLAMVLPATGSQAGGTLVDVLGDGLDQLSSLAFGSAPATIDTLVHPGLLRARTPKGQPGTVDVRGSFHDATLSTLSGAFTYFDPVSSDVLTWGGPVDGALNVSVMVKGAINKPISGAVVTLAPLLPDLHGVTDDRGQVTLAAQGLHGPVQVHAFAQGYTAGSVVAVSVENVVIRLTALPVPQSGNGSGGNLPPSVDMSGKVTGTVVDSDKYAVLPSTSCAANVEAGYPCAPCADTEDCSQGQVCVGLADPTLSQTPGVNSDGSNPQAANAPQQKHCLLPCQSDAQCPQNYACRLNGLSLPSATPMCLPLVGARQIRCAQAAPSIFGGAMPPGNGGTLSGDGNFLIDTDPGDIAIYCIAGYVELNSSTFVPQTLGLARHVAVSPGATVNGIVIRPDIALDRQLRVRMDQVPVGPDSVGGVRSVTAGLDLGAEGYVPIGNSSTKALTDTLILTQQPNPAMFTGDNAGIRYEIYGSLANSVGGPPMTVSQATGQNLVGLDRPAQWLQGSAQPTQGSALVGELHATAWGGNVRVAVGQGGRIAQWTGTDFTVQASPTKRDLYAVWLMPDGNDGWAAGADGVLVRRTPLGWQAGMQALGRTAIGLAGRATNDVWALDDRAQLYHFDGYFWTGTAGPWTVAAATPPPAVTTGTPALQLHGLWQSPQGTLYLCGDQGQFLRATPTAQGPLVYESLSSYSTLPLRAVWGRSDTDVWVLGDRGYLGHWNGQSLALVDTGSTRTLLAMQGPVAGYPLDIVGAQGTWLRVDGPQQVSDHSVADLRVDLRGILPDFSGGLVAVGEPVMVLGPYLQLAQFAAPTDTKPLGNVLQWTSQPGVTPSFSLVRLADQSYLTRWELYVKGDVTTVQLPNLATLPLLNPLPNQPLNVRLWRAYAPGLDIDHLDAKAINSSSWTSWSYSVIQAAGAGISLQAPPAHNAAGDQPSSPAPTPQTPWGK